MPMISSLSGFKRNLCDSVRSGGRKRRKSMKNMSGCEHNVRWLPGLKKKSTLSLVGLFTFTSTPQCLTSFLSHACLSSLAYMSFCLTCFPVGIQVFVCTIQQGFLTKVSNYYIIFFTMYFLNSSLFTSIIVTPFTMMYTIKPTWYDIKVYVTLPRKLKLDFIFFIFGSF